MQKSALINDFVDSEEHINTEARTARQLKASAPGPARTDFAVKVSESLGKLR